MIKDVLVHYYYLLGLNPNEYATHIPSDFEVRWLDDLPFIPPPADFVIPAWATPHQPGDSSMEDTSQFFATTSASGPGTSNHFVSERPEEEDGRIILRLTKSQPKKRGRPDASEVPPSSPEVPPSLPTARSARSATPPASPPCRARETSSPPPPPSKRGRSSSPPPTPVVPQHSSTLRSVYDITEKSPLVPRLQRQRLLSKPAKKAPRMSSTLGEICSYCAEPLTKLDLKLKNGLVSCSGHKVHKYCQQSCLDVHSDLF